MSDNGDAGSESVRGITSDEIYLRIWEKQQDLVTSRWAILTFFLGISFALFGFSFQNSSVQPNLQRATGFAIYFFSYAMNTRYSKWSHFLRNFLFEMEQENRTQIDLHKKVKESREWEGLAKLYNINRLLQYFGIIYFFVVIYFWNCG